MAKWRKAKSAITAYGSGGIIAASYQLRRSKKAAGSNSGISVAAA